MPERKLTVYIQDLNMSQRSTNVLLRKGITTLNKLESCELDEIKSFKGLGKDSLKEIYNILEKKDKIFETFEKRMKFIDTIPEDVCNTNIFELGLSNRALTALRRAQINTVGDLIHASKQDISAIPNIGNQTRAEIYDLIESIFSFYEDKNQIGDGILKDLEEQKKAIDAVSEDVCSIEISELGINNHLQKILSKAQINTVGELIHTSKHDISQIPKIGDLTRKEIYDLIEDIRSSYEDHTLKEDAIPESPEDQNESIDAVPEDVCNIEISELIFSSDGDRSRILSIGECNANEVSEETQAAGKAFDFDTIDILTEEFFMPPIRMTEWFGLSRQGIYNALDKRSNKRRQKWTGKELTESEYNILLNLIQTKSFEYSDDKVQCHCFNNRKDDFAAVFVYEDEIKCFFLNSLPDELKTLIIEANLQKYTESELNGESDGSVFYFLKQPYFTPNDLKKFRSNAEYRKMTLDEYSRFLTGYPYSVQRVNTDERIVEFLENSLVDGKVYISSDSQNQWIRTVAARNGFGIKEFVEFYGYEYSSEGRELTEEAARQRHIQELQKHVVDGNIVYFPSDSRLYKILNTYAYNKGISINDYIKSLGFERTTTPPERQVFELEEDMQVHDWKGTPEDRIFAKYPLLGSKILSKENLDKLDELTKKYIDRVLYDPLTRLSLKAKMQITLSVINHAKNWDTEENSKFWEYIILQYGYRDRNGSVLKVFQNSIEDALKQNKRLFVETQNERKFKSTVLIHALSTKRSWNVLFDLLFDFYKDNLNWKIVPKDPLIETMIRVLQGKFSGIESEEAETISVGSKAYLFQEGIRKLVLLRPEYTRNLFEKLLVRIDALINSAEEPVKTYEDQLCEEWFKGKLISIANSRKTYHSEETEEREVAIDYSRIRAKLILYKENQLRVVLPDIRLQNENFTRAVLTIHYNEKVVYQQSMSWYGNELGKTLNGVSIPLPDFTDPKDPFNIQIVIKCDDEEIYNSESDLYYKLLAFSGKQEINPARLGRGNYTLLLPMGAVLENENIVLTRIDQFKTGGLKAYFAELKEGYILTVNSVPIAFDREIGQDIRVIAPTESSGAPTFLVDDKEYHFVNRDSSCTVIIDNPEILNRYALLINDLSVPIESLAKTVMDQGEAYTLPVTGDDDLCKIRVLDLENERLLYERNFCIISSISNKFNREFYFSYKDYTDAEYCLQINGEIETVYFTREDEYIQIPYKNGIIQVIVPKIEIEETTGKWFNAVVPAWYIDDIPQNSLFKVTSSANVTIRFFIGGIDIQYDGGGLVGIGNVLQSLRGANGVSDAEIEMMITGSKASQRYRLSRVFFKEGFLKKPNFWTEQNQLSWDCGGSFIGKPNREFTLQLKGEDGNVLTFKLDDQTTCIDLPEEVAVGNYQYEICVLSGGLFKTTKEILDEGECIIGDKNALRFHNRRIVIDSITDVSNEVDGHIVIKTCYIERIEYLGEEDTSEGYCPVYSGRMYSLNYSDGQKHYFSSTDHVDKKGNDIMTVNPVRIIYIGDTTLCITDSDGDGLYYYYYYDKYLEQRVYAITDHKYTKANKSKYSNADLYSYHTEKE